LSIIDIVRVESEVTKYNRTYLETKRDKMHHMLH